MKNEFWILILLPFLCLTSCEHKPDRATSTDSEIYDKAGGDTSLSGKDRAILDLSISDSSKFHFFVENPAGTTQYQRFNFHQNQWQAVDFPIQKKFIGGPLHTGRIIHQNDLWQDSSWFFLYSQQVEREMVLEVKPLALIEINDNPLQSVYILMPVEEELQPENCTRFDDWFTTCNDQRFFIQYWIEHQFAPRYIRRIQWKPFAWPQTGQ